MRKRMALGGGASLVYRLPQVLRLASIPSWFVHLTGDFMVGGTRQEDEIHRWREKARKDGSL